MSEDKVNHPAHYQFADPAYEAINVIEAWRLDFSLGNAMKYIARAPHKGTQLEDLKKARWYINRRIEKETSFRKYEPIPFFESDELYHWHQIRKAWKLPDVLTDVIYHIYCESFVDAIKSLDSYIQELSAA